MKISSACTHSGFQFASKIVLKFILGVICVAGGGWPAAVQECFESAGECRVDARGVAVSEVCAGDER